MKIILKKITFPFFKSENHDFLIKKWWFRLIIVLYTIGIITFLYLFWSKFSYSYWGWCFDLNTTNANQCVELSKQGVIPVFFYSLFLTLISHYIIQLIFFKIIINFVVLDNKK